MYTITNDGRPLFDPTVPGYALENPQLALDANKFGTLSFTIYPDNPEYNRIELKQSRIKVYRDGTLFFEARPAQYSREISGEIKYTCEDGMSRLNDVLWRPKTLDYDIVNPIRAITLNYPTHVQGWLDFHEGVVSRDPQFGITIEAGGNAYSTFWDAIARPYIDECGGYFVPTYTENNGIYLNYYGDDDHLPTQPQVIEFGRNIQNLKVDIQSDDYFTVLVPQGADVKIPHPDPDEIKKMPLTIESENDGKDYLETDAVASSGWIEKTMRWDWIKDAQGLMDKAQDYIDENGRRYTTTMTINALDLHDAGIDPNALQWMTRVRVISPPHGIDDYFTVRRMEIMLGEPSATVIEIGNERPTVTNRVLGNTALTRRDYNALDNRIFVLENTL